jgi:hypothetical protein
MPDNTEAGQMINQFVQVDSDMNSTSISSSTASGMLNNLSLGESTAVVGVDTLSIDSPLRTVWNGFVLILSLLFAPFVVLNAIPNVPTVVSLLILVPNIVVLVFGTISFLRGYDW